MWRLFHVSFAITLNIKCSADSGELYNMEQTNASSAEFSVYENAY
jgi:hypothetical protein